MPEGAKELGNIRARIDDIDEKMHKLLLERGSLIERLQQAKGLDGPSGTSAMRPAREAQMMSAISARHSGPLPLKVVERIWREIIAGFTQLQAPFKVVLSGADKAEMLEIGLYYFGVTTPLSFTSSAREVLDLIAEDESAAGVIADEAAGGKPPWWVLLAGEKDNPARVVARLPFFTGHESGGALSRVCYVLSRAPVEPSGADMTLVAAKDAEGLMPAAEKLGGARSLAQHGTGRDVLHLLRIDGCHSAAALDEVPGVVRWLGGYGVAAAGGDA